MIATADLTCWDYRQPYLEQKTRLEAAAGAPVPAAAVTCMLSVRRAEIIAPGAGQAAPGPDGPPGEARGSERAQLAFERVGGQFLGCDRAVTVVVHDSAGGG